MVQVRVQPLYSMASSIAHDFFRQEANPLHLLCVLIHQGRDVTRISHTSRLLPGSTRDLLIKKWFFSRSNSVCACSFPHAWDPGSRDANPALWLVERGHVNNLMRYPMLMSHVITFSLSDWLRATFAALWLVTDYVGPVHYFCFTNWVITKERMRPA